MKRFTQIIFITSIIITLVIIGYFYMATRNSRTTNEPVRSRVLEANSTTDPELAANLVPSGEPTTSSIPLEPNETLLDLYSFNLDFDDEEEQILVIRESDDPNGIIKVVLADYSPLNRKWNRAWKGSSLVTKNKTFQVSVNDLIGDHNLNIVCTGMNNTNEQTMTIYWKSQDLEQKQGTIFLKVFEQAGSAVIIEEVERPDSYKLGQSNAESWPISVWKADASSGNYLDQLRELWHWSFTDKAYVKISTESIPGASIAQKKVESILDGTTETFKLFLDGTWYKESIDPLSPAAQFITFQSRDDSLLFSGDGLIEVYGWENSNPTRYGLYIASRNQSVRNLRRLMDIELASADSIQVRVFQDYRIKADISGRWDGRYRKLGAEIATSFKRMPAMATTGLTDLSGIYESDSGMTLVMEGTTYRMESATGLQTGSLAIYTLDGKTILDMRQTASNGETPSRLSWIAESTFQQLSLQEVKIGILGIEPSQDKPLLFRKMQQ